MGLFKKYRANKPKRVARRKKRRENIKTAVNKVRNKAKEIVDKAKEIGGFAVLAPIAPLMKAGLRKRGYSTSGSLQEVAVRFYNEIVAKNNFDEYNSFGTDMDVMEQAEIKRIKAGEKSHIEPVTISLIISSIVGFIKGLKAKRDSGVALTDTQKTIVDYSDKLNDEIEVIAKDEIETKIVEGIKKYWWVAVVAVVGFIAYKRK